MAATPDSIDVCDDVNVSDSAEVTQCLCVAVLDVPADPFAWVAMPCRRSQTVDRLNQPWPSYVPVTKQRHVVRAVQR